MLKTYVRISTKKSEYSDRISRRFSESSKDWLIKAGSTVHKTTLAYICKDRYISRLSQN